MHSANWFQLRLARSASDSERTEGVACKVSTAASRAADDGGHRTYALPNARRQALDDSSTQDLTRGRRH